MKNLENKILGVLMTWSLIVLITIVLKILYGEKLILSTEIVYGIILISQILWIIILIALWWQQKEKRNTKNEYRDK